MIMQPVKQKPSGPFLLIGRIIYLALILLSLYLLILSRTGETQTIWQVLHPALIPTLFLSTSLLFLILLTSEKVSYKLMFVIIHSILIHSLFSIILPAGDLSGQQMILGRTRPVFDNTLPTGLTKWSTETIPVFIFDIFKGTNMQAALCTILARMLSLDIFWVHLFFVPVLWGIFVPVASFLITRALGSGEKEAVLSSLLVAAFPYTIYFGAISVPNSLGFIFFYFSLYFMIRYLSSNSRKTMYWMSILSFFSLLFHSLTGVVSFSLLLLAIAFKAYQREKGSVTIMTKATMIATFFVSAGVLPLSLIYLGLFRPSTATFTLSKLYELPTQEIAGLLILGDLIYGFDFKTILLVILGPVFGMLCMIYFLHKSKHKTTTESKIPILFLFTAFLVVLVDYRVLKLFMEGLPINEERLWVFRDFIAVPFLALGMYAAISILRARTQKVTSASLSFFDSLRELPRRNFVHYLGGLLVLTILVPFALGGWVIASLSVGYPQVAPLQTTSYELEAVRYIEEHTNEKYVVIGDVWTIFAGEMVVGVYNPNAFYFGEQDPRGYNLFSKMLTETSPDVMIEAMNQTGSETTTAHFVITEPRLDAEDFNDVVLRALQNGQLIQFYKSDNGKLYVFSYRKT